MTAIYIGNDTYEVYLGDQKCTLTKDEVTDLYEAIVMVDQETSKES